MALNSRFRIAVLPEVMDVGAGAPVTSTLGGPLLATDDISVAGPRSVANNLGRIDHKFPNASDRLE